MLFLLLSCVNSTYIRFIADKHRENIISLCERGKAEEALDIIKEYREDKDIKKFLLSAGDDGKNFLMKIGGEAFRTIFNSISPIYRA